MSKSLILILVLVLNLVGCLTNPQPLWCFAGIMRDFRCHNTLPACEADWHQQYDAQIVAYHSNPLPCEEF